MSDPVAIAIVQGVVTIVGTVATVVTTLLTRRRVKKLDETVRREHAATRQAIGAAPADVIPRTLTSMDTAVPRHTFRER